MITQSTPEIEQHNLQSFMAAVRPDIESALLNNLPVAPPQIDRSFGDAMRAALFSGGKRIRPILTMLGAEIVGGAPSSVLAPATAVEYIHTSSLIFDDLPCMDNTLKRRGQPALHIQYGEDMAVLVALALLNKAYSLVLEKGDSRSDRSLLCHSELTRCVEDQIFGQALDIISPATPLAAGDREGIRSMRNLKASALVRLSLILGAIYSDARAEYLTTLSKFAALLGDAYQISDDINDKVEDGDLPGQPRHDTLLAEYGEESAKLRVAGLIKEAKTTLVSAFGLSSPAVILCGIADYVKARCG